MRYLNSYKKNFKGIIMSEEEVLFWISELIKEDKLYEFYNSKAWRKLRKEVLDEYKYECQMCKAKGIYTKANHVHHVQWVRKHPRFALSKTYAFQGVVYINLIPLCHNCHEKAHGHRQKEKPKPITEERW